ncbi:MAG: gamma-glutamyl-phosphate reductase, partial [Gammaproteobacteria bacterium]|nr:gamma-glutamyl-phosphate reductase [Gammaproteobacteria bacterium]
MNIKDYMSGLGQQAKAAGRELSRADSGKKNSALLAIAEQLTSQTDYLVAENAKDLQAGKEKGLDAPLLERLELTPARIEAMIV